ncbi:carboxymuconolactone decarboxylase family protein [Xenophilus aerolatus]|nr:carboxymuconolactone decarboxylase family protein [Xenophilus aerolatus]
MARLPYFDLDQASPEIRHLLKDRPPLNIYRMVAHGGPAAEGFLTLGTAILRRSSLSPVLRELVILRVGVLCGSRYELTQHRRVAAQVGVPAEKVAAVLEAPAGDLRADAFDELEALVLSFTEAVVLHCKAPPPLTDELAGRVSRQQMLEITMTIGYYMLVCRLLETFEVDLEEADVLADVERWPNVFAESQASRN